MFRAVMGRILLGLILIASTMGVDAQTAPRVDRALLQRLSTPLARAAAVITYEHQPTAADFTYLRSIGITGGWTLSQLPMVLTAITRTQLDMLRTRAGVVSIWGNHRFPLASNESRSFIGVGTLRQDADVARSNGVPVTGRGIGIAYVDTGIDATHPDLQLGNNVVQNVLFPVAEYAVTEWPLPTGFTPIVAIEDQPISDVEGGHGTFGAAVTAGTGQASGDFYGGVAPGAKLVGLVAGNDVGLTTFGIVQAYNYALANQIRYNIRVCNNSFGDVLANYPYDPFDPINVGTRELHDHNIAVVFAAGNGIQVNGVNEGDVPGAINPLSVAPWVISVGAGEKHGIGAPTRFSSRGENNGTGTDTAGMPADPLAPPNLRPDLIGSGSDIKSARSKAPGVTNVAGTLPIFVGGNDLTTIAPAFLPFYTTSQGTSFSTPQVSGVVALMLEANPTLTPDEVVTLLRESATPMPHPERVVGAGYVDARNAVRAALSLSAVEHPADLFPRDIEIWDPSGDQLGTSAQDIRSGDFTYDEVTREIVYTLTLTDLSAQRPNNAWNMSSKFGGVTLFVSAEISETGAQSFSYGKITVENGINRQTDLGPADSGQLVGNRVIVRLAIDKVSAAVGYDVLYTTSTAPQAIGQILIGSSLTGGLLLASDVATGSDFQVGVPPPPGVNVDPADGLSVAEPDGAATFTIVLASRPTADVTIALASSDVTEGSVSPESITFTPATWDVPQTVRVTAVDDDVVDGDVSYLIVTAPASSADSRYQGFDGPDIAVTTIDTDRIVTPVPCAGGSAIVEHLPGTIVPGDNSVDIPVNVRRPVVEASVKPDSTGALTFQLIAPDGSVAAQAAHGSTSLQAIGLPCGDYTYRLTGAVSKAVDFVIKSKQRK